MAICFHRIGYVSRRSGRSSALACGYITATRQTDARTGVTRNYQNKITNVTHTGHCAPDDAPAWANSYDVWNHLERHVDETCETRYKLPETITHAKNTARTSQTHIFALPIELSSDDYHILAKRLIHEQFIPEKLVTTYGIHEDKGNPHLHILNALHQIDENGFIDTKHRVLYANKTRLKLRHAFAELCNEMLSERGFTQRVDPRSHAERGLNLEPELHEGWYARKLAEEGAYSRLVEANKEIRERNKERILMDASIVLKELSQTHATFSAFEALSHVQKRMNDDPTYAAFVYEHVLKEAVIVGHDLEGEERYASPSYVKKEATVLKNTEQLLTAQHPRSIHPRMVQRTIDELKNSTSTTLNFTLNDEQQNAIQNLCESTQLSILVGRAGTGKTSSLKPVVELHKEAGFNVIGLALAAEAARHLGEDAGIESFTLASYEQRWKSMDACQQALLKTNLDLKTRYELQAKLKRLEAFDIKQNTLVLVDEAGMVGTESMHRIVKRIMDVGAKGILIGDDRQFKAIAAGDIFRKMVEEARVKDRLSTLTSVVRQQHDWMRKASEVLSEFDASAALDAYHQKGYIHQLSSREEVATHIAENYVEHIQTDKNANGLVITFTNEDCALLNAEIRSKLQSHGKIDAVNHTINNVPYAINDQIIFLHNQPKKAASQAHDPILMVQKTGFVEKPFRIRNGTKGTVTHIIPIYAKKGFRNKNNVQPTPIDYRLIVSIEHNGTTYEAAFLNSAYNHFQHGYAITLYKAQGQTVDWSMVYATKHMDSIASYVAMTRHRKQLDIYYTTQEFPTLEALYQSLNRLRTKDLAADYGLVQEHANINDIVQSYFHLGKEMTLALKSGDTEAYNDFKEDRVIFAKEILAHFKDYGHVILQAGLTKANLEITAGLRQRTLSHVEEKLLITLEQYIQVALDCRTLWNTIRSTHPGVYAKDHPRYALFQEKQQERGALASVLSAHAPITRSFGKELYAGTGYGFATIQKQAIAFKKERLQNECISSLSPEEQELIHLYKQAEQYQRFAGQIYAEHQAIDKPLVKARHNTSNGKVLFKTLVSKDKIQEKEKIDFITDGLCHALTRNPRIARTLKRLLTHVGISSDLKTMNAKGKTYERRQLIHTALQKDMSYTQELHTILKEYSSHTLQIVAPDAPHNASATRLAQYSAAATLIDFIAHEHKTKQKARTKAVILNQAGREGLHAIYDAARQAERLQVNPVFVKENRQRAILQLINYRETQAKANRLWKVLKAEAEHKNIRPNQTTLYHTYQKARREQTCCAHDLLTQIPLIHLRQANALLSGNRLNVCLDRIEQEAQEGCIQKACEAIKNPTASKQKREDAVDTLVTALALDETRAQTHAWMHFHQITQLTLQHHSVSATCDAFPEYKEALVPYVQGVNVYKSAFRLFLAHYGHNWMELDQDHPEARAVHEATLQRNEAAFNLQELMQRHGTSPAFNQLLESLKTTFEQLMHQRECHESLMLAKAFKQTTQTHEKAEVGYQLLERFVLETGMNSPRSAAYALKAEQLTLKDLSTVVHSTIHLNASNALNRQLFAYKQDVLAFSRAYQTLMDEFNDAKHEKNHNQNPAATKIYISHMDSYPDFWECRMRLAEKAYYLLYTSEQITNYVSASTLHKMGGYAHIHETYILLKGYLAAKEQRDPIALTIAAEIYEIMAFEEHEHHTNPKAPLAYGIRPALYHFEIDVQQLKRDADGLKNPHSIRARDIGYLFDPSAAKPLKRARTLQHTQHVDESHTKTRPHDKPGERGKGKRGSFDKTVNGTVTQQPKQRSVSVDQLNAFSKEVKQHLLEHIETVAISLLGHPKEMGRTGIWKWPKGIRLHTRTSTRVPRGTFKIYAEGTENLDIFTMIKRTHNVTNHFDAVQLGARLCSLSLNSHNRTQQNVKTLTAPPITLTAKKQPKTNDEWTPIYPVPREAEHVHIESHKRLSFMLNKAGRETMRFAYRDSTNRLLGYVVRLEDEQGKKQTLPLTYCTNNTGKAAWKWKGFGDSRPLYGLDRLAKNPDKPVLLVEGEKAADAAQHQFPEFVVMSWVGGSAGVHKVDLTPIYDKPVIMWPDNDEPGFKAANTLQERFAAHAKDENRPMTFAIIDIPCDQLPPKWDLADALPETLTAKDIQASIGQALNAVTQNKNEFHSEQEKEQTRQRTNHVYEKTFSFEEITHCAEKEGLSFLSDETHRVPLILHTANEAYKELTQWHTLHGDKPNFEQDKRQAMLTGLYTTWAHEKEQHHAPEQAFEKAEQIGARAGMLHCDPSNKHDPHVILWKAEKEVAEFENHVDAHQQNHTDKQSITAQIEAEIWHASHQCQSLSGKAMSLDLAKEIGKHLQETYHHGEHKGRVKSHEIRSVIKHMVKQKIQHNEIKPVTHEEALTIHAQRKIHKQHCMQQHQEQMKHIEQQHKMHRQHSRGMEL